MWSERSLVLSLAIVLTIIDLTQGFTLRHPVLLDLVAEESSHLEVRNDLKRSNDNKTIEKDELAVTVPTLTNTEETNAATKMTTVAIDVEGEAKHQTLVDKVTTETTEVIPFNAIINKTAEVSTGAVQQLDWFGKTNVPRRETLDETETFTMAENMNTVTENVAQNDFNKAVLPTETKEIPNATRPSLITEQDTTTVSMITEITDHSTEALTTYEEKEKITGTETNKPETTISVDTTTEAQTAETTIATTSISPGWKKYTVITRNRVDNTKREDPIPTERLADSINAHTTETRVSLEKVFDLTPDIQSLQELKNYLAETTNTMQTQRDLLETTNAIESQTEMIPSTTVGLSTNDEELTKAGLKVNPTEMVSLRAGYLNHTKMTGSTDATTSTTSSRSETELEGVAYEIDIQENDGIENKTSQSQLAEDAIKEELLKESLISDKEVNSIRYRPPVGVKGVPVDVVTLKTSLHSLQPEKDAQDRKVVDELSVKPISPEKKSTNIYAVNPNYKPLKKIEVQPPKPFTRHPDDNSWRNESLTSLGIVFKAKNSSKAFTEVIKNKTETVMNNLPDQNRTIEKVELRDRLEKIAEKRKSKKNKIDKFGNTEYTDYEENNNSGDLHASKQTPIEIIPLISPPPSSTTGAPEMTTVSKIISLVTNPHPFTSTEKPKKVFNLQDYYDGTDDDDYVTLPNVDIMKSTSRPRVQWPVTQSMVENTNPKQYLPERKPTVQYFPPRPKPSQDVNVNEYDDDFKRKVNLYNLNTPKSLPPIDNAMVTPERSTEIRNYPIENNFQNANINYASNEHRNYPGVQHVQYRPINNNVYLTQAPKVTPAGQYDGTEGYSRGFIIRHYKDLIEAAIKDSDYDRNAYLYTESPVTGVTANDVGKTTVKSDEYDYEQRKEVLDKFVDNFNQNHEAFKVDFPVLFNTSIVHNHGQEGGKVLASSSAMFKRLYNDATATKANGFLFSNKPYDPSCENMTVELSPAYELHYYVPEQEEREEQASKVTMPYGYRL